jgi:hypothetical protein
VISIRIAKTIPLKNSSPRLGTTLPQSWTASSVDVTGERLAGHPIPHTTAGLSGTSFNSSLWQERYPIEDTLLMHPHPAVEQTRIGEPAGSIVAGEVLFGNGDVSPQLGTTLALSVV